MSDIKTFPCDCLDHLLTVEPDEFGVEIGAEQPKAVVRFWARNEGHGYSLRLRLREAWRWIRGDPALANTVILSPDDARALGEHLLAQYPRQEQLSKPEEGDG